MHDERIAYSEEASCTKLPLSRLQYNHIILTYIISHDFET